jgi:hypothetical protein
LGGAMIVARTAADDGRQTGEGQLEHDNFVMHCPSCHLFKCEPSFDVIERSCKSDADPTRALRIKPLLFVDAGSGI